MLPEQQALCYIATTAKVVLHRNDRLTERGEGGDRHEEGEEGKVGCQGWREGGGKRKTSQVAGTSAGCSRVVEFARTGRIGFRRARIYGWGDMRVELCCEAPRSVEEGGESMSIRMYARQEREKENGCGPAEERDEARGRQQRRSARRLTPRIQLPRFVHEL